MRLTEYLILESRHSLLDVDIVETFYDYFTDSEKYTGSQQETRKVHSQLSNALQPIMRDVIEKLEGNGYDLRTVENEVSRKLGQLKRKYKEARNHTILRDFVRMLSDKNSYWKEKLVSQIADDIHEHLETQQRYVNGY